MNETVSEDELTVFFEFLRVGLGSTDQCSKQESILTGGGLVEGPFPGFWMQVGGYGFSSRLTRAMDV